MFLYWIFQKLVTHDSRLCCFEAPIAIKDLIVAARLFYETTDLRLEGMPQTETFTEHLKTGGVLNSRFFCYVGSQAV